MVLQNELIRPHHRRPGVYTSTYPLLATSLKQIYLFKDRMHCFSIQVVINKCFLLNPEKKFGADTSGRLREKRKNAPLNPRKMASPSRRLGYSNNQ